MITKDNFISEMTLQYLEYLIEKYTIIRENSRPEYYKEELPLKTLKEDLSFKTFLKRDKTNNYYIIDKKRTIKCYFKLKNIKKCLDVNSSFLLSKKIKNIIINVKHSKIDIQLQKIDDKILLPKMVLIISEFSLQQNILIPYSLLNYHHKDVNLDSDIDKNIRRFLSVMKKLNLNNINDNETNNKTWLYSKIPNKEIIELSQIKFNNKRQIEINKENPEQNSNIEFNEIENKENINNNENIDGLKNNIGNNSADLKEEKIEYNIIDKNDLIKLFFSMPSIKENKIKDFNHYENLDFELLGKKRTREKENNILNDSFESN